MEGNISSGNMIPGSSYGGLDLQGSMRVHHHQHQHQQQHPVGIHPHPRQGSMVHSQIHEGFPLSIGSQNIGLSDYGKGEGGKSVSDDEEPSFTEDAGEGHNDQNRGKKAPMWHRVKWTDQMVRLLITAVSYIGEEASAEYGGRRKCANIHKKGKWKSVSKVMAERGHFVSPQQCEDKFNDLNKRYKRLNEILGRGTSCEVVENPTLLDMMDHIPEKAKDEVKKILSSKHLHYEEMCSYHNGNRLHLPPDPDLQRSLRLALRTRDDNDDNDVRRPPHDDNDDDDLDAELDEHDEYEENHNLPVDHRMYGIQGGPAKKSKPNACFGSSSSPLDCNKSLSFQPQNANAEANLMSPDDLKDHNLQKRWMDQRSLQLEEQKLHIQAQMLELEKERFKWQRFSQKKNFELEMMRMENERMKLENERMALELKQKEMLADNNS
nr:Trihelix transcription factor GT-4 like [Ipomoea batatas]GMC55240.1 Trihelix transcription factor GT-4 like [Ipomoea batatas]GMC56411.1 Trihelix transcription factor GT-4 like [Ipomoea batatas]GME08638.1 Trihelix transcription factor GT-4 like [Ipomoea batatas]